ncbi:(Na+)-NQR maturation NqrM [Suttonella ornithocola]|uniref:Protein of uncharacterized function (DUF539) n=1 Tax=Suttonella ornithocola TaxID=279832 RepID=A0A380MQU3_9GAMM|nr:(Na+)-NQR maturation NqrM [Suttonella ornithocola]SUO94544.1 Protein of uncharacterised function (DUF539) [Suttonella ornithocola]
MTTFLIIFVIFALVIVAMAVGVIFGRKPISGSCGGLGAVGVERACGCTDVCKNSVEAKAEAVEPQTKEDKAGIYRP